MLSLKKELLNKCFLYVEERIQSAQNAIEAAKDASQDDTKSSAGDKYETTREMMQQEISRNETQLMEAKKLKYALLQISVEKLSDTVQAGSVVFTSSGNFFISVSAGEIKVKENKFVAISQVSPIGKVLWGLRKGSEVMFNGKMIEIATVA